MYDYIRALHAGPAGSQSFGVPGWNWTRPTE